MNFAKCISKNLLKPKKKKLPKSLNLLNPKIILPRIKRNIELDENESTRRTESKKLENLQKLKWGRLGLSNKKKMFFPIIFNFMNESRVANLSFLTLRIPLEKKSLNEWLRGSK